MNRLAMQLEGATGCAARYRIPGYGDARQRTAVRLRKKTGGGYMGNGVKLPGLRPRQTFKKGNGTTTSRRRHPLRHGKRPYTPRHAKFLLASFKFPALPDVGEKFRDDPILIPTGLSQTKKIMVCGTCSPRRNKTCCAHSTAPTSINIGENSASPYIELFSASVI